MPDRSTTVPRPGGGARPTPAGAGPDPRPRSSGSTTRRRARGRHRDAVRRTSRPIGRTSRRSRPSTPPDSPPRSASSVTWSSTTCASPVRGGRGPPLGSPVAGARPRGRRPVPAVRAGPRAAGRAPDGDRRAPRGAPRLPPGDQDPSRRAAGPAPGSRRRSRPPTSCRSSSTRSSRPATTSLAAGRTAAADPGGRVGQGRHRAATPPGWRGRSRTGTDEWAIGRERHDALVGLRAFEGLDADAILALGWERLAEEHEARIRAAREIDPDADARGRHRAGQGRRPGRLRGGARGLSRVDAPGRAHLIEHDLITVPSDERIEVIPTPEYLRNVLPFAAYFQPAAFDADPKGIYVVTPSVGDDPEAMLRAQLRVDQQHEHPRGVPGPPPAARHRPGAIRR